MLEKIFKNKTVGFYVGLAVSVYALVIAIYYGTYTAGFDLLNVGVLIMMLLGSILQFVFLFVPESKFTSWIPLVRTILFAISFALLLSEWMMLVVYYLTDSYDLAGTQADGQVLLTLIILFAVATIVSIVTCFLKQTKVLPKEQQEKVDESWNTFKTNTKTFVVNHKTGVIISGVSVVALILVVVLFFTLLFPILTAVRVTEIKLSENEIELYETKQVRLSAEALPENADNLEILWSSSNENVATVDSLGFVTAISEGEAVIVAKAAGGNVEANCTVTVLDLFAEELDVTKMPDKTLYVKGEKLDTTGIVIEATLNNGEKFTVTDECTFTPEVVNEDVQTITASYTYGDKTATTTFDVLGSLVFEELQITTPPDKLHYIKGETLDTSGIVVKAKYNGGTEIVDVTNECKFDVTTVTEDKQTVTVSYDSGGLTRTATFEVYGDVVLNGIKINRLPDRTHYKSGEKFSPSGMNIVLDYTNREPVKVNVSECTFDVTTVTQTQKVTVSYKAGDKTVTAQFDVYADIVEVSTKEELVQKLQDPTVSAIRWDINTPLAVESITVDRDLTLEGIVDTKSVTIAEGKKLTVVGKIWNLSKDKLTVSGGGELDLRNVFLPAESGEKSQQYAKTKAAIYSSGELEINGIKMYATNGMYSAGAMTINSCDMYLDIHWRTNSNKDSNNGVETGSGDLNITNSTVNIMQCVAGAMSQRAALQPKGKIVIDGSTVNVGSDDRTVSPGKFGYFGYKNSTTVKNNSTVTIFADYLLDKGSMKPSKDATSEVYFNGKSI